MGATALAHNEDGEYATPRETVASKVAEILGIEDEQLVKDALIQATQEVQMERLNHRLDHMVEAGVLDQDQANEYLAWYADRPEGPNLHRNRHRFFGFGGGEGEERGPGLSFERMGGRGQDFPGFGHRPDGSQSWEAQQFPNGGQFPGRGEARSRFSERFDGRQFPGRGQLPTGLDGEASFEVPTDIPSKVPQGNGASF
tara:strand:- start:34 stop:630 length:597 start_codon:yes stop_codon:yes gene_type:complete